ncbi:phosphatidylethanolamine-binding protein [Podospora aff. communis PSN243]|uniref:Phosphatidylethanolamine-binding protein n=1 Tax=Podospora aff. communis PSN243 TaxID=3040156 RepID=A0AAV9GLJ3_9PEZI|nr:phosphatidylethanolamine-binding protein [Podospora aff. communis PSN243]
MIPTFSLAALALATVAMADDNARPVSTLEFKNLFVESGIVPEVIAALDPSVSFYAGYRSARDGHSELLVPGASLTIAEASLPIEFSVESLGNATGVTQQTRYLIYLLDADAPARDNPSARNLRHYLAGNYTLATNSSGVVASDILPTASRLTVAANRFFPFTQFTPPNPQPNTGVHRFIYALYTQPSRFDNIGFESVGMDRNTQNWNLSQWRTQLGLGPAIGATFFTIDTGANNGQGTSANRTDFTGTGTSAAATHSVSLFATGLTVAATVLGLMAAF